MTSAGDLWTALGGSPANPVWREPRGRVLARVSSDCGRRVASVFQEATFPLVVVPGYRLTRAHTNMVIFDQALLDLEDLLGASKTTTSANLGVVRRLIEKLQSHPKALPTMVIPETRGDVATLAIQVAEERLRADAGGFKPREFDGLATACGKCKRVHYLGDDLAAWWSTPPRPTGFVVSRLRDLSKSAGWDFPTERLADRMVTYERLTALLE